MAVPFQVSFDAADPHRQARFWAEAMGYLVEDNSALINQLLDAGQITDDDVTTIDGRAAWREAAAVRDPDAPYDPATGVGHGGRLLFQTVPEAKTTKNRVHLDLHVGSDRLEDEVKRLVGLGATFLYWGELGIRWATLTDPEGNEFCIA